MKLTQSQLRRIIKEELEATVKEGVLDTADILGQYEKWIRSTMRSRGVSAEEAIMDFVILAIAGGDYHLDPTDEHDFDENAFRALLSANPAMVAALSSGEPTAEEAVMNEAMDTYELVQMLGAKGALPANWAWSADMPRLRALNSVVAEYGGSLDEDIIAANKDTIRTQLGNSPGMSKRGLRH